MSAEPSVLSILFGWLPFTGRYTRQEKDSCPTLSPLLKEPGMEQLAKPHITPILGAARMLSKDSLLPEDHLFTALLKTKLAHDILFLFDSEDVRALMVVKLGRDVCGHAQIVHGGLTSSIFDETFGGLVYIMKHRKLLDSGIAVTANLSVNYRKPIETQRCVLCTVKVKEISGRKMFLEGVMTDVETGVHYADATALFINMKAAPTKASQEASDHVLNASATEDKSVEPTSTSLVQSDVQSWHVNPQFESNSSTPSS